MFSVHINFFFSFCYSKQLHESSIKKSFQCFIMITTDLVLKLKRASLRNAIGFHLLNVIPMKHKKRKTKFPADLLLSEKFLRKIERKNSKALDSEKCLKLMTARHRQINNNNNKLARVKR